MAALIPLLIVADVFFVLGRVRRLEV